MYSLEWMPPWIMIWVPSKLPTCVASMFLPKVLSPILNNSKPSEEAAKKDYLFEVEPFGFASFALAIIIGLFIGTITIPLSAKGYKGPAFSLGTTGGVLIICLIFGHLGKIGNFSLKVNYGKKFVH